MISNVRNLRKELGYEYIDVCSSLPNEVRAVLSPKNDAALASIPDCSFKPLIKTVRLKMHDLRYAQISYHRYCGFQNELNENEDAALECYLRCVEAGEQFGNEFLYACMFAYDRALSLANRLGCYETAEELMNKRKSHLI